jgi:Glycine rich protein
MRFIGDRQYPICTLAARLLGAVAVSWLFAGCAGGSTSPAYPLRGLSSRVAALNASCQGHQRFSYSGQAQTFEVPACATSVYVEAAGAAGAHYPSGGGDGGEVSATIPVTPGETLTVMVGGAGLKEGVGGFNGGGAGAIDDKKKPIGGGGGGASDVREGGNALADRVVVAGGGGGPIVAHTKVSCRHCQAMIAEASGGAGGVPDGGGGSTPYCNFIGTPVGGGGGTQSSGGVGGAGSNDGSLGQGGTGVDVCIYLSVSFQSSTTYYSGGGGGGYYGGGGGGSGGGGGGGSGYAESTATNVTSQDGVNNGNGSVVVCWGYANGECSTP